MAAQARRPPSDDIEAETAEQMDMGGALKESDTPERLVLQGEIARTIQAALDELPDDLRTAITLRELEGFDLRGNRSGDGMPNRYSAFTNLQGARSDRQ